MTSTETTKTDTKAKDYKAYATKTPTGLHAHYAAWLQEKTGVAIPEGMSQEAITKLVQLSVSLYHDYQASDENKARRAAEEAAKPAKEAKMAYADKSADQLEAQLAKLQAALKAKKEAAAAVPTDAKQKSTSAKAAAPVSKTNGK